MSWFRLDDKFHSHPKVIALFDGPCPGDAIGLWTLAGSWVADQRTDGFVPAGQAKRFGLKGKAAAELVRVGLWVVVEGGYQFHQYLERNPSRQQLDEQKEKSNARVTALREREKRQCNGVTNALVTPLPVPSHSLPKEEKKALSPASVRDPSTPEQEREDAEFTALPIARRELWERGYQRRYALKTGNVCAQTSKFDEHLSTLVRWSFDAKIADEACEAMLDSFFADTDPKVQNGKFWIGFMVPKLSQYAPGARLIPIAKPGDETPVRNRYVNHAADAQMRRDLGGK